jgi:hypothetical protein
MPDTWTHHRARLAATRRHDPDADTSEIERDLRAARLEDHVRRVVDEFPPLTDAQRNRLAVLLRGGGADAAT